jgi:hypothetical protein
MHGFLDDLGGDVLLAMLDLVMGWVLGCAGAEIIRNWVQSLDKADCLRNCTVARVYPSIVYEGKQKKRGGTTAKTCGLILFCSR